MTRAMVRGRWYDAGRLANIWGQPLITTERLFASYGLTNKFVFQKGLSDYYNRVSSDQDNIMSKKVSILGADTDYLLFICIVIDRNREKWLIEFMSSI